MTALGDQAPRSESRVFVGRDREVAELVAALEDAIDGQERLFLITGEPGIGKTWLVEHIAEHATTQGIRVYWGRCWEGGGAPPFWPWGQVIGALADDYDEQTLASWLGAGMARVAQLVPGFAERLGISTILEPVSRESDAARFYLFEAVTGLFRYATSAQPMLLIFEDLHAADEPSRLLLEFVVRQLRGQYSRGSPKPDRPRRQQHPARRPLMTLQWLQVRVPKVFGMHEIELQPGVAPEDYERFSPKSSHRRSSFRDGRPIF